MNAKYRRMIGRMREKEAQYGKRGREKWHLYILRCNDGSLYTGVTKDIERRLARHNAGMASRFTRVRRPVKLVYSESLRGHGKALVRECAVKALPRGRKEALIESASAKGALPQSRLARRA